MLLKRTESFWTDQQIIKKKVCFVVWWGFKWIWCSRLQRASLLLAGADLYQLDTFKSSPAKNSNVKQKSKDPTKVKILVIKYWPWFNYQRTWICANFIYHCFNLLHVIKGTERPVQNHSSAKGCIYTLSLWRESVLIRDIKSVSTLQMEKLQRSCISTPRIRAVCLFTHLFIFKGRQEVGRVIQLIFVFLSL